MTLSLPLQADTITDYIEVFIDDDLGIMEVNSRYAYGKRTLKNALTQTDKLNRRGIAFNLDRQKKDLIYEREYRGKRIQIRIPARSPYIKIYVDGKEKVDRPMGDPMTLRIQLSTGEIELYGATGEWKGVKMYRDFFPGTLDLNLESSY